MSGQHCENYDIKWKTVHCYPRNVDHCCTWSEYAVESSLTLTLESQHIFQHFLLFLSSNLFFYITNHLMTGPLGNSEFTKQYNQHVKEIHLDFHEIHYSPWVQSLNSYWMRLSMISWIIKTEVCVICRSRRLRQIAQTRGFDNSCYHAKTEFNNCFIIRFSHNSYSETEAKHSAILFLRRTLQGA